MEAAESPAESTSVTRHPLVERVLDGAAADALRLAAARGALPIPKHDLLYIQVRLLEDTSPAVVEEAKRSLEGLTLEAALPILKDTTCDPKFIDYLARSARLEGEALEIAVAHPDISDSTLEALAKSESPKTLNLLVTNEARIIRNPALVDLLRANPNLSADDRRRLSELERDFIGQEQIKIRPIEAPAVPPTVEPAPPPETEAVEPPLPEELPEIDEPPDPSLYEEAVRKTASFQKIMKMGVPERLQLARGGTTEERSILIRDSTKMVAMQVLKNPKLSENEVCNFASMRNVHDDVLRSIAAQREWIKSYAVINALIRNPKTPPGLSMPFLARLGARDLKLVTGDRNIPDILRRQARNLFLARTQRGGRSGRKGG